MNPDRSPDYSRPYQKTLAQLSFFLLLGLSATLLFDQGRYKLLNYVTELSTLVLVIGCWMNSKNANFRKQILTGLTIMALLIMNQFFSDEEQWPKSEIKYLAFMFCLVASTALLPAPATNSEKRYRPLLALALMVIACTSYLYSIYYLQRPFGPFENPHFLSLQIVILVNMCIFFIFRYALINKVIAVSVMLISFHLLTLINSKIAWAALAASFIVWGFLFFQNVKYIKIFTAIAILAGVFASTQFDYADHHLDSLSTSENSRVIGLWRDQRIIIWADSIAMQKSSDLKGWLFGHGLGNYESSFQDFSRYSIGDTERIPVEFVFPHNFFLEVLYNSGIIGLLALSIPAWIIISITYKNAKNRNYPAMLALALLTGVFMHTFFTLPLFTRFPSMSLAMIFGYCLWLNRNEATHAD